MGRHKAVIGCLFIALLLGPVSGNSAEKKTPPDTPLSLDELVDYFDTIVFRSEFESVKASKVIKKWTGPIRLGIRSFVEEKKEEKGKVTKHLKPVKVKKPYLRFIKNHLNSLVRTTGLKTEAADNSGKPPNFIINFMPRDQLGNPNLADVDPKLLNKLASQGGCYFLMWADGKTGSVRKAIIVVNSERLLIRINHCLLEEMTQSLGLPNDTNFIKVSIFSDSSRRTELTPTDKLILKVLYDPRMKAGLPRDQALPIAREIIGGLMPVLQ